MSQPIARWVCPTCGKRGPWMLERHAREAARWHRFIHPAATTETPA